MAKFSLTGYETGASDLGAIVPVGGVYQMPFGNSPNDVLTRHRAALEGVDLFPASRIMEAGNRFEDAIRIWFEDEFNCQVETVTQGYRSERCNLVASLDGIIRMPQSSTWELIDYKGQSWTFDGDAVIDFKSPTYAPNDPEAANYMLQLQGQMDATGLNWGILAQLDRARCEWTISVFQRHNGVIQAIHQAVNTFWEHMANDTNYPPIDSKEASRLIAGNRKAPAHDLTEGIDDTFTDEQRDDLITLANTICKAKAETKAAQKVEENAKKSIMDIIGGVEKVTLPGAKISWSTTEYKAQPEKITPAKPASTGRRFSVKEIT